MEDHDFDHILNIETGMERNCKPFLNYYPYEPTPYHVLEQLAKAIPLEPTDCIVDYGCGKGRLLFYLNSIFGMNARGIEMDEHLYQIASQNRLQYSKHRPKRKKQIEFFCTHAEKYIVQPEENKFYFFNPFSVHIFIKVYNRIVTSLEQFERDVDFILYYPFIEYISFLENRTVLQLTKEVKIEGDYDRNPNERILVYSYNKKLWDGIGI
jgi:SAM-dependent methyltransferase